MFENKSIASEVFMFLKRNVLQYLLIVFLACVSAANYNIFVFPNSFAPAGVDGLCTMVQDLSGVSIGYLSFAVNIPLLIAALIFLNRDFAVKTTVYVAAFSAADIILKNIGISAFAYSTPSGTSIVLAPIAAGVIRGILYVICIKNNASSGGVDIIASLVKRKRPYFNFMNTIFAINFTVACISYFVYGFKLEPVICSIIYCFTTSTTSNSIQTSKNETIKYEIITPNAERLCNMISSETKLGATVLDVRGGYSGMENKMVVCVMPKNQVPQFKSILRAFDMSGKTVIFKSVVNNSLADI